jgi:hypothetical protein
VVGYTSNGQTLQQIAHANGITDKEVLDAVANGDLVNAKSNIAGQGPLHNVIARYDIVRPDHREALRAHALISAENDAYTGGGEESASLFGLTDEADLDAVQRAALYGAMYELNRGATLESVGDDFGISQIALDFHPLPGLNCAREHACPGHGDAIRRTALDGAFDEFGKGAPLADVMNKYRISLITVASGRRPVSINLDRQNASNINLR